MEGDQPPQTAEFQVKANPLEQVAKYTRVKEGCGGKTISQEELRQCRRSKASSDSNDLQLAKLEQTQQKASEVRRLILEADARLSLAETRLRKAKNSYKQHGLSVDVIADEKRKEMNAAEIAQISSSITAKDNQLLEIEKLILIEKERWRASSKIDSCYPHSHQPSLPTSPNFGNIQIQIFNDSQQANSLHKRDFKQKQLQQQSNQQQYHSFSNDKFKRILQARGLDSLMKEPNADEMSSGFLQEQNP